MRRLWHNAGGYDDKSAGACLTFPYWMIFLTEWSLGGFVWLGQKRYEHALHRAARVAILHGTSLEIGFLLCATRETPRSGL